MRKGRFTEGQIIKVLKEHAAGMSASDLYLEDICQSFSESLPDCLLHVNVKAGIEVPPDQAIPVALFVNELITNSAKYGHPNRKCEVWIEVVRNDTKISVSVRDQGIGLPPNFEPKSKRV